MERVASAMQIQLDKIPPLVRAQHWWRYKIAHLLVPAYVLAFVAELPLARSAEMLLALAVYLVATAALGFFLNDCADIEEDRLAGKQNVAGTLSPPKRAAVVCLLLIASLIPWAFVRTSPLVLVLIAAQIACFLLYSFEPFRLKETALGLIIDALYAHLIPYAIVVAAFGLYTELVLADAFPLVALAFAWQGAEGLRNIIAHQLEDAENDRASGTATPVLRMGVGRARVINNALISPIELGVFVAVLALLSAYFPGILLVYVAFLGFVIVRNHGFYKQDFSLLSYNYYPNRYTNEFYDTWLGPLILVYSSIEQPAYLLVLGVHLLLFRLPICTLPPLGALLPADEREA